MRIDCLPTTCNPCRLIGYLGNRIITVVKTLCMKLSRISHLFQSKQKESDSSSENSLKDKRITLEIPKELFKKADYAFEVTMRIEDYKKVNTPEKTSYFSPLLDVADWIGDKTGAGYYYKGNKHPWRQEKYHQVNLQLLSILSKHEIPEGDGIFQNALRKIDEILRNKEVGRYHDQHIHFLQILRNTLWSKEADEAYLMLLKGEENDDTQAAKILYELSHAIYTKVEMYTFMNSVLEGFLMLGGETAEQIGELSPKTICKAIDDVKRDYKQVRLVTLKNNFIGAVGTHFDPHRTGNLPSRMFSMNLAGKEVHVHRQSTPTIGWEDKSHKNSYAMIAPEYLGYLRYQKLLGKKHLYISLQDSVGTDADRYRTDAIKSAIESEEFKDTAFFIVLDQESPFYKQTEGKEQTFNSFKLELVEMMFGKRKDSRFYFPDSLKNDADFHSATYEIIDLVHRLFFNGKKTLTCDEKKAFFELFYSPFILYLTNYTQADNLNITCKDDLDRAGKVKSLLLKFLALATGTLDEQQSQEEWATLSFAPPILTKSQPMVGSRLKRLRTALEKGYATKPDLSKLVEHPAWKHLGIDPKETGKITFVNRVESQEVSFLEP